MSLPNNPIERAEIAKAVLGPKIPLLRLSVLVETTELVGRKTLVPNGAWRQFWNLPRRWKTEWVEEQRQQELPLSIEFVERVNETEIKYYCRPLNIRFDCELIHLQVALGPINWTATVASLVTFAAPGDIVNLNYNLTICP